MNKVLQKLLSTSPDHTLLVAASLHISTLLKPDKRFTQRNLRRNADHHFSHLAM